MPGPSRVASVAEVAIMIGRSRRYTQDLISRGRIKGVRRIGPKIIIIELPLEADLEDRRKRHWRGPKENPETP